MPLPFARSLLTTIALTGTVAFAAGPIEMNLIPVFDNFTPQQGVAPVVVELTNNGGSATGVLRVSSQEDVTDYPIELPAGSTKRITTYGRAMWGQLHFSVVTNRARVEQDLATPSTFDGNNYQNVALVADQPGGLGFIRQKLPGGGQSNLRDTCVRPSLAPERSLGYGAINVVVLGEGSERLNDAQVNALQLWTLSGGTLVFAGGASPTVLRDPRWQNLIPATDLRTKSVKGSPELARLGGVDVEEPFTITAGKPKAGSELRADGTTAIVTERPFGLGRTILYAFNPFEAPLDRYPGMNQVFSRTLMSVGRVPNFLRAYTNENIGTDLMGTPGTRTVAEDPFSMKLPPPETIFTVLGAYFLFVVPLNFLVLRKLKKGELAWFTAPVMSLAFAGVLFQSAKSLYSASLSTATQGILVAQQGMPEAMFMGTSQMFVPQGGTYDLKLDNIDSLGMFDNDPTNPWGSNEMNSNSMQLQPVDVGELEVPRMRAANLAFREMFYRQRVPAQGWFSVRKLGNGKFEVRNGSPYNVNSASLFSGYGETQIGELPAGAVRTVEAPKKGQEGTYGSADIRNFTGPTHRLALGGRLQGFRPGPQIGREVEGRRYVAFAYFTDGEAQ